MKVRKEIKHLPLQPFEKRDIVNFMHKGFVPKKHETHGLCLFKDLTNTNEKVGLGVKCAVSYLTPEGYAYALMWKRKMKGPKRVRLISKKETFGTGENLFLKSLPWWHNENL